MRDNFYITTTLPYVNAEPHIGFALEIIQADVLARFHKEILKQDVVFNFGTDEHGQKIYQKSLEAKKDPQAYCDEYASKFNSLKKALNLSYTNFIRTTDPDHISAAQEFWRVCDKNGDIYKKLYETKYCVGCELEKTDSELINGRCPLHPDKEIEIIKEENYFFRFSKYQKLLLDFYNKNPQFVVPEGKYNEIKSFVESGLNDFSISRLKSKMPWGIQVPNDPEQVMYVWFDALINYISTLGWPADKKNFQAFWPGVQVAGKDNLRQQSAIWQAMLASAGLPLSKQIFIHGFITVDGKKISKSLGNTINPILVAKKFQTDALRYYLLSRVHPFEDSDFTFEKLTDAYNGELANGLGNLISRVAALCQKSKADFNDSQKPKLYNQVQQALEDFRFDLALKFIWDQITVLDLQINKEEPWKLVDKKLVDTLQKYVDKIRNIAYNLKPFLPETAQKISDQFSVGKIQSKSALFPRI